MEIDDGVFLLFSSVASLLMLIWAWYSYQMVAQLKEMNRLLELHFYKG